MTIFLFFIGLAQCVVLYFLGKTGDRLVAGRDAEWAEAAALPIRDWPSCAMIVPVGGRSPFMEPALHSLAQQDYPAYTLYLVTATADDQACALIGQLERQYGHVMHVVAGEAGDHGQKNHNLLAGMAAAGDSAEIYAFCDSTHIARPDFLRCLVDPLVKGEAEFTTGYHQVVPRDQHIVTLAYVLSVFFMHFMQGIPGLAQPWGGAMAMNRRVCEHYGIRTLWQENVVDDCSLGALLARKGVRVRLCPGAILATLAADHAFPVWRAWFTRQILFLKFCMPREWLALSLVCCLMTVPPIWCGLACLCGILGFGGGTAPFLALCWFCVAGWTIGSWRRFMASEPAISRWLWAFFCASLMFTIVYLDTLGSRTLLWNNIRYKVGPGGRVTGMERLPF